MKSFIIKDSTGAVESVQADYFVRDHVGWVIFYRTEKASTLITAPERNIEVNAFFSPAYVREVK